MIAMPLPALSTSGCQKRVSSFEPASAFDEGYFHCFFERIEGITIALEC
jgi:hypothetical protein